MGRKKQSNNSVTSKNKKLKLSENNKESLSTTKNSTLMTNNDGDSNSKEVFISFLVHLSKLLYFLIKIF